MSRFLPTGRFKWIDPKECNSNKFITNSLKDCVVQINLEYPKELCQLHNYNNLAPDKIQIKKKLLSNYQLKIDDIYKTPVGNVKKLLPKFFDKALKLKQIQKTMEC